MENKKLETIFRNIQKMIHGENGVAQADAYIDGVVDSIGNSTETATAESTEKTTKAILG